MNNEKILNIKINEEDYERIILAILNKIHDLNCDKNSENNVEEKEKIEFNIYKHKLLMSKLEVCKLYNE